MNPRELVDHIHSGPANLVLDKPLRFRRRTRSNPCDFNEFLQALQSSETIRYIDCESYHTLGISEDEWVLLVKTLGTIRDIQRLDFFCKDASRDFHPLQAVADAVNNAQSLLKLFVVQERETFPRDPSGMIALANALREHTALEEFGCVDFCSRMEEVSQSTAFDPVLWALPACPHLRKVTIMTKCASPDAVNNLLQLKPATDLRLILDTDQWLAVADEIRRGRCIVQRLKLGMLQGASSEASEAVKALASAIPLERNLEHLTLRMENGYTDEAGVALAVALTVNKTLRKIDLFTNAYDSGLAMRNADSLGVQSYEAFSAMLRVNTCLVLEVPPFETAGADERLCQSRDQLRIEQRLNHVGRGRLSASIQTTREQWVDALCELDSGNIDDSPAFQVSCLFSVLRSNPTVVCMS
jgi:hypothetical protein